MGMRSAIRRWRRQRRAASRRFSRNRPLRLGHLNGCLHVMASLPARGASPASRRDVARTHARVGAAVFGNGHTPVNCANDGEKRTTSRPPEGRKSCRQEPHLEPLRSIRGPDRPADLALHRRRVQGEPLLRPGRLQRRQAHRQPTGPSRNAAAASPTRSIAVNLLDQPLRHNDVVAIGGEHYRTRAAAPSQEAAHRHPTPRERGPQVLPPQTGQRQIYA